jgi:hypothetical protein
VRTTPLSSPPPPRAPLSPRALCRCRGWRADAAHAARRSWLACGGVLAAAEAPHARLLLLESMLTLTGAALALPSLLGARAAAAAVASLVAAAAACGALHAAAARQRARAAALAAGRSWATTEELLGARTARLLSCEPALAARTERVRVREEAARAAAAVCAAAEPALALAAPPLALAAALMASEAVGGPPLDRAGALAALAVAWVAARGVWSLPRALAAALEARRACEDIARFLAAAEELPPDQTAGGAEGGAQGESLPQGGPAPAACFEGAELGGSAADERGAAPLRELTMALQRGSCIAVSPAPCALRPAPRPPHRRRRCRRACPGTAAAPEAAARRPRAIRSSGARGGRRCSARCWVTARSRAGACESPGPSHSVARPRGCSRGCRPPPTSGLRPRSLRARRRGTARACAAAPRTRSGWRRSPPPG